MYTKYKNGAVDYDLICCSDYMIDKMIKEKEVKKIDYGRMKYIKNIGKKYWNWRRIIMEKAIVIDGLKKYYTV